MAEKGQLDMFMAIYEAKIAAGKWKSEISGKPLPHPDEPFFVWCFAHIIPKSIAPRYKLNPDNISLLTPTEHQFYEHFTERHKSKAMYKIYARNWDELFEKRDRLKILYHATKNEII